MAKKHGRADVPGVGSDSKKLDDCKTGLWGREHKVSDQQQQQQHRENKGNKNSWRWGRSWTG